MDRFTDEREKNRSVTDRRDNNRDTRMTAAEMMNDMKASDPELAEKLAGVHFEEAAESGFIQYMYNAFIHIKERQNQFVELIKDANRKKSDADDTKAHYEALIENKREEFQTEGYMEAKRKFDSQLRERADYWKELGNENAKKIKTFKALSIALGILVIILIAVVVI